MARENSHYMSVHFTKDQYARFEKLVERVGMNKNSLMRLIAERMQPSDVDAMLKRG